MNMNRRNSSSTLPAVPLIYSLLNGGATNWEVISNRIHSNPEEVRWCNARNGYSFIHSACFGFTNRFIPPYIVQEIIAAYPEVLSVPVKDGWLPLHFAALYESPLEIVSVLLESHRDAISTCNDAGNLPLHLALWQRLRGEQVGIVKLLLESSPEACGDDRRNQRGLSAWDLVSASWVEDAEKMKENTGLQECLFDITMMVLRARFEQRHGNDAAVAEFLPLHAIMKEDKGNLFETDENVRRYMMENYGDNARIPDENGRLCLHMAVENGMNWRSGGGLSDLGEAAPPAIISRDVKTGLYPFQLAAVDDHCDLDTILHLVRRCVGCFRSINIS
mmetsp:Transcript_6147/g.8946  ORF Transcript_6147/g.8946 Transcript_6147/m.8946 type:complete len:333 (+) Transcript_6147:56-1054(+)